MDNLCITCGEPVENSHESLNLLENSATFVNVENWGADACREYLRYVNPAESCQGDPVAYARITALVSRVRTRLASLQLAELWPVDPRD